MTLTGKELQDILNRASQSVRDKAKSVGAPLFYVSDGKWIREDADGKMIILRDLEREVPCRSKIRGQDFDDN
jgi:hypothetical protein